MAAVVDDQLLLHVLAGNPPPSLADEVGSGVIYTTSCWFYRLARAVLSGTGRGILSRLAEELTPAEQEGLQRSLRRLPEGIGTVSPRLAVPVMAELGLRREVNMLSAEALAIAMLAEATIVTRTPSPALEEGAAQLGVSVRLEP